MNELSAMFMPKTSLQIINLVKIRSLTCSRSLICYAMFHPQKLRLQVYESVTNYEQSYLTKNNIINHSVIGLCRSPTPRFNSNGEKLFWSGPQTTPPDTHTHVTFNTHEALSLVSCVHDTYHSYFCWRYCLKLNCILYN